MIRIGLILLAVCSLQQLDAQSFKNYSLVRFGLDHGLPSNSVFGICQDNQGRIWLGTENGLAYLDNGLFHHLDIEGIPKLILAVYPASDGGIFVVGNSPSVILKLTGLEKTKVIHSLEGKNYTGILLDFLPEEQAIYYSDWDIVVRCTENSTDTVGDIFGSDLRSITVSPQEGVFLNKATGLHGVRSGLEYQINTFGLGRSICLRGDTLVTIGDNELRFYDPNFVARKSIPFQNDDNIYFPNALVSNNGNLWFTGLLKGLYFSNMREVVPVHHLLNAAHTQFTSSFEDRQGNLWFGTNEDGAFLLRKTGFTTVSTSSSLSDEHIKSVSAFTANQKLVVTRSGAHFISEHQKVMPISLSVQGEIVPSTLINYIITTPIGTILGASYSSMNRVFNGVLNDSTPVISAFSSAAHLEDEYISIGSWGRHTRLHFDSVSVDKLNSTMLSHGLTGKIVDIVRIDSGLVLATDVGIHLKHFQKELTLDMPGIAKNESIQSLELDQHDSLWCITERSIYNWSHGKWKAAKRSAIPSGAILEDFAIDESNRFWIGCQYGLYLIDGLQSSIINMYDGLAGNEVTSLFYDKTSDKLWIGTKTGLSIGHASIVADKPKFSASIQIDSITTLSGTRILSPKTPKIQDKEKLVNFHLSAKEYFSPAPIFYRYRLKGISNKWFNAPEGVVTFQTLGAGNYNLEVGAKSLGGSWSDNTVLHFQIERSFWNRWEVYFVMTLLVLALTALVYTKRVKRIRKREQEKRTIAATINELEMKALNANMNPHFIFNSLNSIQHYLIPLKNRKAFDFIANLSRLIRLNMAALGHKQVNLEGELKRTELYVNLEKERLNNRLQFEIRTNLLKEPSDYQIPSMIIQPLVENSIWHGIAPLEGMGEILLSITQDSPFLIVKVTDNGVGLTQSAQNKSKSKSHDSVATKLTHDRLKHHHPENSFELKELFHKDGEVIGTEATLRIYVLT